MRARPLRPAAGVLRPQQKGRIRTHTVGLVGSVTESSWGPVTNEWRLKDFQLC